MPNEPAVLNGDVYEISNAGQLYWFADQVNIYGNTAINGKLMADIVVNENVLDANGILNGNSSPFRRWNPIGWDSASKYTGIFDDSGNTVSGLFFGDAAADYVGLFGYVYYGGVAGINRGSAVSDCNNADIVRGTKYVGGIVGSNQISGVLIQNLVSTIDCCYNTGIVKGDTYIGGIAGANKVNGSWNSSVVDSVCTLTNCYNTGSIDGNNYVGGVAGINSVGGIVSSKSMTSVTNCHNVGTIRYGTDIGGVIGANDGKAEKTSVLQPDEGHRVRQQDHLHLLGG